MTTSRKAETTMTPDPPVAWAEAMSRAQREAAARAAATATAAERAHAERLEVFEAGREGFWLALETGVRRVVRAFARGGGEGLQILTAGPEIGIALLAPAGEWSATFRLQDGPAPAVLVRRQSARGREEWPPLEIVLAAGTLAVDLAGDALDADELVRVVLEPLLQQFGAAR
jgi:hypothetical protein